MAPLSSLPAKAAGPSERVLITSAITSRKGLAVSLTGGSNMSTDSIRLAPAYLPIVEQWFW